MFPVFRSINTKKRIYLWIFLLTKSPNELIDTEFVSPIPISSIIWSVPMISSSIKMAKSPPTTLRELRR